jgi:hypothetical protein
MMKHGDAAWAALALGVLLYECFAPPGQLMSEACDKYRIRHPILTNTVIVFLAGHLLRVWPRPIDPLHQLAVRANR